jgi:hypothetical protein
MLRLHIIAPRILRHVRPRNHALRSNPGLRFPYPTPPTKARWNHIQTLRSHNVRRHHRMFKYVTIIYRAAHSDSLSIHNGTDNQRNVERI